MDQDFFSMEGSAHSQSLVLCACITSMDFMEKHAYTPLPLPPKKGGERSPLVSPNKKGSQINVQS